MENELEKIGFQNLRIYAQEIGVRSPTSLSKKELIEKIKEIESGKVEPYYSKRGRPRINTLNKSDKNSYLDKIEKENLELKEKIEELNKINQNIEKEFNEFKNIIKGIIKDL